MNRTVFFVSRAAIFVSLLLSIFFLSVVNYVGAQSQLPGGVAYFVPLGLDSVPGGSIVSLKDGGYVLSASVGDSDMAGVIELSPSLSVDLVGEGSNYPMVSSGQVAVLVHGGNGPIVPGDWVTSSEVEGVGVKAIADGYVLGHALDGFDGQAVDDQGIIRVAINIHYSNLIIGGNGVNLTEEARESLFDLLGVFQSASSVSAPQAFRFILAGMVALFALLFGFFTFGRVAQSGVEAIGRNPLARRQIMVGVVFNVIVSIIIILSGVVVAFFVIRV